MYRIVKPEKWDELSDMLENMFMSIRDKTPETYAYSGLKKVFEDGGDTIFPKTIESTMLWFRRGYVDKTGSEHIRSSEELKRFFAPDELNVIFAHTKVGLAKGLYKMACEEIESLEKKNVYKT